MTKREKAERDEAAQELRKHLKPGDTLYTILEHVSRSGMSRRIRTVLLTTGEDGKAVDLHPNYLVAQVTGFKRSEKGDGLTVGGCGMDMGFHLVYNLSSALYPEGFGCIGKGCPSNDHSNGDRDYTPHEEHATGPEHICAKAPETCTAKAHWHNSGGYAIKQRWL